MWPTIFTLQGERAVSHLDFAKLYGGPASQLNEAMRRSGARLDGTEEEGEERLKIGFHPGNR